MGQNSLEPGRGAGQNPIELRIAMHPNGSVQVTGPIANKILSYGLLEQARDAIKDYKPPDIVVPDMVLGNGFNPRG